MHHGGFRSASTGKGSGKSAVFMVCEAGKKATPFFIVFGANVMSCWFKPLHKNTYRDTTDRTGQRKKTGFMPSLSADNYFNREKNHFLIQHIDKIFRRFVPANKKCVLKLDGHSSRKGHEWLELSRGLGCIVIQGRANTTHFLQPCDQQINKTSKATIRETCDALCNMAVSNTKSIQFKLLVVIAGYRSVSEGDIRNSFTGIGL